jgi:hypothetical protein
MPKASKKSASSAGKPPFVPPTPGQLPPNYRPAVHTSVRASDLGNFIDAEWTTFAQVDPKTGDRTGQLPYWFTSSCVIRNARGQERLIRLRDIGAQPRRGLLRIRVTGATKPVVTLSRSGKDGSPGKPVKPVGGFYPIEASQNADGSPSHKYYTLSFRDPVCLLECYNAVLHPPDPCPPGHPGVFAVYGYPPPGTPE